MTTVRFRNESGRVVLEVDRDPFEVCELARRRLFPDQTLKPDLVFQQIVQGRKRENRRR